MFLDVLLAKKLVTVLDSQVGQRSAQAAQDAIGEYGFKSEILHGKESLKLNTLPYVFKLPIQSLHASVSKLPNYAREDEFRLMVFVPVNDCKYADKVPASAKDEYDFGTEAGKNIKYNAPGSYRSTPIVLLKTLTFEIQFTKYDNGRLVALIN